MSLIRLARCRSAIRLPITIGVPRGSLAAPCFRAGCRFSTGPIGPVIDVQQIARKLQITPVGGDSILLVDSLGRLLATAKDVTESGALAATFVEEGGHTTLVRSLSEARDETGSVDQALFEVTCKVLVLLAEAAPAETRQALVEAGVAEAVFDAARSLRGEGKPMPPRAAQYCALVVLSLRREVPKFPGSFS